MDLPEYLKKLGLGAKEARTYLACLELGESNIVPIAEKVKLPRTSVAYLLEKLQEEGLIEILERRGRKHYIPYPPRNILTKFKEKEEQAKEHSASFAQLVPELNRLYENTPHQPKVRIFKGEELRDIYEEMLNTKPKEICYVGSTKQIEEVVGARFLQDWVKRRAAAGIWTRAIRVKSEEPKDSVYAAGKEGQRDVRYAPTGFKSPANILIYGDTVVVVTTAKESFGVVTTSPDYATSMQSWFEELWEKCA
ncbi:MAG TPA: helix-turn-helix domain-containing protein [Verrucomicrobiae bacterium]|nr:helix-turn-helix domain-containing protein [Verrucomicrobiae bacterium]